MVGCKSRETNSRQNSFGKGIVLVEDSILNIIKQVRQDRQFGIGVGQPVGSPFNVGDGRAVGLKFSTRAIAGLV